MKRLLLLLVLPLLLTSCQAPPNDPNLLTIDVLNVGKADCIVIRQGGKTVMVDTGEEENYPVIASFLRQFNVKTIDVLILSHFDKDHIGGAEKIINHFSVQKVIESSFSSDREEYDRYHKALASLGVETAKLREDLSFTVGNCSYYVMTPRKQQYEKKQDNNASLIVEMTYNSKHFAFFGDALKERLEEYQKERNTDLDFAKLPHHGSFHKGYVDFLSHIQCEYAVITDSQKNPADEKTLSILEEKNVSYFQTQKGSVRITYENESFQITQN